MALIKGVNFHFDNLYFEEPVKLGSVLLWQVGDICCTPGFVLEPHKQYCYEITYIVSGTAEIGRDDERYGIKPGQFFMNRPGDLHSIYVDQKEQLRYFYLGFDFASVTSNPTMKMLKEAFDNLDTPVAVDVSKLPDLFTSVFGELILKDAVSWEMIRYYIYQILLVTYRSLTPPKSIAYILGAGTREPYQLVYRLVNYIDNNVLNINKLTDLSKSVGYSYSYVSSRFKKVMGVSLSDYYNQRRFEKGKEMLDSGMTITEVAKMLKFQTLQSFSKAFKLYHGVSPIKYRQEKEKIQSTSKKTVKKKR